MKRFLLMGIFLMLGIFVWFIYPGAGVPILAYHQVNDNDEIYSISPAEFEAQMRYLADNGYTAISLNDMFEAFKGNYKLPAKPIIITFDDGYEDNYLTALPIMEKYNMHATVFVIAGSIDKPEYLTWQQIREMQTRNTEIGSHTMNHLALDEISAAEERHELADSKAILEQGLGTSVKFLAYPYGQYDIHTPEILKETGYVGACTGKAGLNVAITNPYMLKRVNVPQPKYGLWEFRIRLLRAIIYGKLNI